MIEKGMKGRCSEVVTEDLTADKIGSGLVKVFATPMMVALMERTCSESVAAELGEDECTVGTLLEIKHTAATAVGMIVTCECELVEVDGRRLRFHVRAYDDAGDIGDGMHERFIVTRSRFEEKAGRRASESKNGLA
ncbi:MAG: thioesterase family protein [Bacteroidales bacterium]|nr:thioesterase family protein [Bacteroidales bacterium]